MAQKARFYVPDRTKHHSSVVSQEYREKMKTMDSLRGQGTNHSDTLWYRADLQRPHRGEDTFSCLDIFDARN
jgi:hypothetical protein